MSNTSKPITEEYDMEEDDIEFEEEQRIKERMERLKYLKLIKTARGIDAINEAVDEGYTPLIYDVKPSEKIRIQEVLIRNTETGKVKSLPYNYYAVVRGTRENSEIVMKVSYYPYQFPPFAAYLLPDDLKQGERVILDDMIEDIIGASHSEGRYRLDSAEAIWDGEKFIIDMDSFDVEVTMG